MKRLSLLAAVMILGIVFSGCASVSMVSLPHRMPGSAGLALKTPCKVKLIAIGERQLSTSAVESIASALNSLKSGGVSVVYDSNAAVDYYVVMSVNAATRVSTSASVPYNSRKYVAEQDGKYRGRHIVVQEPGMADTSSSMVVSVSIYSVSTFEPVYHFEVPMYDGELRPTRSVNEFIQSFVVQLGQAFNEKLTNHFEHVATAIPKAHVDNELYHALCSGSVEAVEARAKQLLPEPFDVFIGKVLSLDESARSDHEGMLCSYYLWALAREQVCIDIEELRSLHHQYTQLLCATAEEGLSAACAQALGRIEKKTRMLGQKL